MPIISTPVGSIPELINESNGKLLSKKEERSIKKDIREHEDVVNEIKNNINYLNDLKNEMEKVYLDNFNSKLKQKSYKKKVSKI